MERLIILVGRLYKSAPTKYFFKVPLVGHFMPLVGVIIELPFYLTLHTKCHTAMVIIGEIIAPISG